MTDTVWELSCNLDDMTPEDIAFAMERLLDAGALDVWTTPIGMKKNRPGIQLSVLSREDRKEELAQCLFRHTTTLGIRQTEHRVKTVEGRFKPEYEDLRRIALEQNIPIAQVRQAAEEGYDNRKEGTK